MSVSSHLVAGRDSLSSENISALNRQNKERVSSLKCRSFSDSFSKSSSRIGVLSVIGGGNYHLLGCFLFVCLFYFAFPGKLSHLSPSRNRSCSPPLQIQLLDRHVLFQVAVMSPRMSTSQNGVSRGPSTRLLCAPWERATLLWQRSLNWEDVMSTVHCDLLPWWREGAHKARQKQAVWTRRVCFGWVPGSQAWEQEFQNTLILRRAEIGFPVCDPEIISIKTI